MTELNTLSDHDLLITLISEVKALREDLKRTTDATSLVNADHEVRLRSVEKKQWTAAGASGIIGAGLSLMASHFIK